MSTDIHSRIQSVLDQVTSDGTERGMQCTVFHRGKLVVNAFAGTTDASGKQKVDAKTLFPVFSSTKGIAATLAHLLVERGKLSYETPLAGIWPGFAAQGKGGITLRHALAHTAGLANLPVGITLEQLDDWNTMCRLMAEEKPVSGPGARFAYHAITYSWLVGEPACIVTGKPFQKIVEDEISGPLGMIDEMYAGIPDEAEPRVATLESKEAATNVDLPHAATDLAVPPLVQPLHAWMNQPDARRACMPASNGIMTAHSMAKHYAALLPGGVDGVELLPPSRIKAACELRPPTEHPAGEAPPSHRLGYAISGNFSPTAFGHGGFGGSYAVADPEHMVAFGYTHNSFVSEVTLARVIEMVEDEFCK